MMVVLGHAGGPPVTASLDRSTLIGYLVGGLYNNLWNGPAAVIAFFVISGFCIHYPFASAMHIPHVPAYAARRLLRVGLPMAVVVALSPVVGVSLSLFHAGILWSLLAELVYYLLYPALLALRRRGVAWRSMWATTFAIGLLMAATKPAAGDYGAFGPSLNWLLGLPTWLAGCDLAERAANRRLPGTASIWSWRLAVWGAAVGASVLRFHSPLGYPWTLNVFAVLVWAWIAREMTHAVTHSPGRMTRTLEWMGAWSYSLYLVHVPALAAWQSFGVTTAPVTDWFVRIALVLGVSYAFYRGVERPSHIAARRAAQRLATPTQLRTGREQQTSRSALSS